MDAREDEGHLTASARPAGADVEEVALLAAALGGDASAVRALVQRLAPAIQARVAIAVGRRFEARGRNVRAQIEDLTQDVFVRLFEKEGACLRSWRPDAGLSLRGFVGLVADRHASGTLRTDKRSPFTEAATAPDDLAALGDGRGTVVQRATEAFETKELLDAMIERLRRRLSPQGFRLFELLFVDELAVQEVSDRTALSADAVYAWRSRIGRLARDLRAELLAEQGATLAVSAEKHP